MRNDSRESGFCSTSRASGKTYLAYAAVAAGICVILAVELELPYLSISAISVTHRHDLETLLSLGKFIVVSSFFMHLYYESRLRLLLVAVVSLALAGMLVVLSAVWRAHELERPVSASSDSARLLPPDPRRGAVVFQEKPCFTCHTISSIPKARGRLGPDLDGIADRASTREPGMSAEAYIRESITKPEAYIVPGFPPAMPPNIRDTLSRQEYEDLVAYLMTLHEKK